jgi:transcriptional regulator with XRE-family HTH domain
MGRKDKEVTSLLRRFRQERGVPLTRLAKHIGYTKGYLSAIETGKERVTGEIAEAYERGLGLAPGTLKNWPSPGWDEPSIKLLPDWVTRGLMNRQNMELPTVRAMPLQQQPVVQGVREVLSMATSMVVTAAQAPPQSNGEILIASRGGSDSFELAGDLYGQWQGALKQALNNGWNVVHLRELEVDPRQRVMLVEEVLSLLSLRGRYEPCYFPPEPSGRSSPEGLLIIPNLGALLFFATRDEHCMDAGFFFSDEARIQILRGYFGILRSNALRLVKVYPSSSFDFHFAALQAAEQLGERMLLKDGLSLQTAPPSVMAERGRRVMEARHGDEQLNLRLQHSLEYESRRFYDFEQTVKSSTVRHMITKESVGNLLESGIYSFDDPLGNYEEARLTWDEAVACITRLIHTLKAYPNFELGLVDRPATPPLSCVVGIIGKHTAILEVRYQQDRWGEKDVNLNIFEPVVVNEFREHLIQVWENLPDENKEKERVIEWLNEQIGKSELRPRPSQPVHGAAG